MSTHTVGIVAGVLYVAAYAARLATPLPPKQPWTPERISVAGFQIAAGVFVVWLICVVVF